MSDKKKIDFETDNLAVPEVTVEDEEAGKAVPEEQEDEEQDVSSENLAFPEYHVKKKEKKD